MTTNPLSTDGSGPPLPEFPKDGDTNEGVVAKADTQPPAAPGDAPPSKAPA